MDDRAYRFFPVNVPSPRSPTVTFPFIVDASAVQSAAAALLGEVRPFAATPWFWSDQYDVKLQLAGLSQGADRWAVRGDLSGASFSVFHFRGDALLAVDSVNAARDHLLARKLLDAGASPAASQVADGSVDLGSLLVADTTTA